MIEILKPPHRRPTVLCMGIAVAALFLAQLPTDVRSDWFRSLERPAELPRSIERLIGLIWTTLFLLAGLAAALTLASDRSPLVKRVLLGGTLTSLALNLAYTFTFTYRHDLHTAVWISGALSLGMGGLSLWACLNRLGWVAACHLPHALWTAFATHVTWRMANLNG